MANSPQSKPVTIRKETQLQRVRKAWGAYVQIEILSEKENI